MKQVQLILVGMLVMASLAAKATDEDEIRMCLQHWGKTPFTTKSEFRVISAKVKVMGIGSDVVDATPTDKPELILVRPTVAVMAKTVLNLRNPQGWYCLKGSVAVMGKMQINLNCSSHLASSGDGATVMGSDNKQTGTTVMGSTQVDRVGDCKKD